MASRLDLSGQRFGKLVAIEDVSGDRMHGGRPWRCRCDCGQEIVVRAATLRSGDRTSCGCARYVKLSIRHDLTGQRFGHLVAIEDSGGPLKYSCRPWRCRCDCGREAIVPSTWLVKGAQTSCGCIKRWNHGRGLGELRSRPSTSGLSSLETDDEILQAEILFELEKAFGPAYLPVPRGPVFHQSLTSDYELGVRPLP